MPRPGLSVVLLAAALPLAANPYLEQVERARPEAADLERAERQLREPPAPALERPLSVPPFHQVPAEQVTGDEGLCGTCHRGPPHRKDPARRAFLNLHARSVACETCHWRPGGEGVEYRWLGEPRAATAPPAPLLGSAPLVRPGQRIAPWVDGAPVPVPREHPYAEDLAARWEAADLDARTRIKARLHLPLEAEGPACGRCHGEDKPLLDLTALGADADQVKALTRSPVARYLDGDSDEELRPIHLRDLLK